MDLEYIQNIEDISTIKSGLRAAVEGIIRAASGHTSEKGYDYEHYEQALENKIICHKLLAKGYELLGKDKAPVEFEKYKKIVEDQMKTFGSHEDVVDMRYRRAKRYMKERVKKK